MECCDVFYVTLCSVYHIEGTVYGSVSFVHLVKFCIVNNTLFVNCSSQHEDRRRDTLRFRRWLLSVYFNVSCEE